MNHFLNVEHFAGKWLLFAFSNAKFSNIRIFAVFPAAGGLKINMTVISFVYPLSIRKFSVKIVVLAFSRKIAKFQICIILLFSVPNNFNQLEPI